MSCMFYLLNVLNVVSLNKTFEQWFFSGLALVGSAFDTVLKNINKKKLSNLTYSFEPSAGNLRHVPSLKPGLKTGKHWMMIKRSKFTQRDCQLIFMFDSERYPLNT